MLKKIIAFFKREDAYARDVARNAASQADSAFNRAVKAERAVLDAMRNAEHKIAADVAKTDAALTAEIAALKKQISALKGQITKLGAKRGR